MSTTPVLMLDHLVVPLDTGAAVLLWASPGCMTPSYIIIIWFWWPFTGGWILFITLCSSIAAYYSFLSRMCSFNSLYISVKSVEIVERSSCPFSTCLPTAPSASTCFSSSSSLSTNNNSTTPTATTDPRRPGPAAETHLGGGDHHDLLEVIQSHVDETRRASPAKTRGKEDATSANTGNESAT